MLPGPSRALAVLALVPSLAFGAGCSRRPPPPAPQALAAPSAVAPTTAVSASPPAPRLPAVPLTPVGGTHTGSTVVLVRVGSRTVAYVADEDDRAVHAVDVEDGRVLGVTLLASRPGQMVVTDDGKLAVALRDRAEVAIFESTGDPEQPLQTSTTLATEAEPVAIALTPPHAPTGTGNEALLLVASGRAGMLEGFGAASHERVFAVPVGREPRAVLVTGDGQRAFVGHAAASELRVLDLRHPTAGTTLVDLHRAPHAFCVDDIFDGFPDGRRIDPCSPFPARAARQIFALAGDGAPGGKERVFVPETLVDSGPFLTRTIGYGGGKETVPAQVFDVDAIAGTAIVDRRDVEFSPVEERGGVNASCILPRAAVVDAKHHTLYVSCLGSDAVLAFDARTAPVTAFPTRRWSVPSGPVGLALDPEHGALVVWSQFDRVVTSLSLASRPKKAPASKTLEALRIALPPVADAPMADAVALGRKLFHAAGDRRIAADGRACASCHPDGRDDGLVWSSPDGPRQTITLAGRVATGPYGWRGESATIAEHVRQTLVKLHGTGLGDVEVAALEAYVRALPPPPSREMAGSSEDPRVARGRTLFVSADTGCSTCHKGTDGFADEDVHDVSSRAPADRFASFETPSLRGVGASAPYFHDGRFATLEDLIEKCDDSGASGAVTRARMGSTSQLSKDDRDALASYLRTL